MKSPNKWPVWEFDSNLIPDVMRHVPALLQEVVEALKLAPGMNVVDCTLGDGGHAAAILEKTAPNGKLLGLDADSESLLRAKQFLYPYGERVKYVRNNFANLNQIVAQEQFGSIQAILIDLGWSSSQFAERGRGFSFQNDESLDMRYDNEAQKITAAGMLNNSTKSELEKFFLEYGEEKLSLEIAQAIIEQRKIEPIARTSQLVEIILAVYRQKLKTKKEVPWVGGLHPATKVFQALRMAVNDELGVLENVLPQAIDLLATGGRLAIISFHSIEDRIVKHFFKSQENTTIRIVNKKPIVCGEQEYSVNTRARSAKLRVVEKINL